jgi:hypothetical protein
LRHDTFFSRKSIHVKLSKELHYSLREKLFRYGITMQDLFQEAARQALVEGPRSEKHLRRLAKKKLVESLEKTSKAQKLRLGELDSEMMYNLMEDSSEDNEDDKDDLDE